MPPINFDILNSLSGIKSITIDEIKKNSTVTPRRICFNTTHSGACHRVQFSDNTAVGAIFLPYEESIKLFLKAETNLTLRITSKGKFWCPANSEEEYQKLECFYDKYKEIVFIRDTLDCSIALAEHMKDNHERTPMGELEYKAKYNSDKDSLKEIVLRLNEVIESTSVFDEADLICSVPPSSRDKTNIPSEISKQLCTLMKSKTNISEHITWKKDKPQLKEIELDEKLRILQETDINVDYNVKDKNIILIDDLYQSGYTMQFVAMKLKEAGAAKIFGISIVKSRKNTDNIVHD